MAQSNTLHSSPAGSGRATSETAPMSLPSGHCLLPCSLSCTPLPAHPKPATQSKAGSTALHGRSQCMDACGYSVAQSRKRKAGHRLTWARPTHGSRSMAHQPSQGSPLPAANRFSFGQRGFPNELLGGAFSRVPQHLLFPCSSYTLERNVSPAAVQASRLSLPQSPALPQQAAGLTLSLLNPQVGTWG